MFTAAAAEKNINKKLMVFRAFSFGFENVFGRDSRQLVIIPLFGLGFESCF